jgi:hypothetical protein
MACTYCGLDHVPSNSPTTGEPSHGTCVQELAKKVVALEAKVAALGDPAPAEESAPVNPPAPPIVDLEPSAG